MGAKRGKGKPKWVEGVDFPMYSGKKWGELQDIWPADMRIADDAYKIVCLLTPAWMETQKFMQSLIGDQVGLRDLLIMCWMQRVEDAKENVGFRAWPVMKGMNIGGALWSARKAKITKLGLVERIPAKKVIVYRLSATGKMIVRQFVENLNKANASVDEWIATERDLSKVHITAALMKFFLPPSEGESLPESPSQPAEDDQDDKNPQPPRE